MSKFWKLAAEELESFLSTFSKLTDIFSFMERSSQIFSYGLDHFTDCGSQDAPSVSLCWTLSRVSRSFWRVANAGRGDINAEGLCQAFCGMPTIFLILFFWCCTTLSGWSHISADELQASQILFMTFNNLQWVGLDSGTRPPTAGGSKRKSDNFSKSCFSCWQSTWRAVAQHLLQK